MSMVEVAAAMKPWEQHYGVLDMPRFAYKPASVLERSVGFLITCTFRREKSATKEVLALLQEYMNVVGDGSNGDPSINPTHNSIGTEQSDKQAAVEGEAVSKTGSMSTFEDVPATQCPAEQPSMSFKISKMQNGNRVLSVEDSTGNEFGIIADLDEDNGRYEGAPLDPGKTAEEGVIKLNAGGHELILVKLATMGVIYICAPGKPPSTVVSVASRIMKDLQAGTRVVPQWCHRMLPVQATCSMKREELQAVVSQLVQDHLRNHIAFCEQPIKYAVGFNRRGAAAAAKSYPSDSPETTVLSRDECIEIVTSAVEQVTTTVRVDLTSPQMVIIVELIPMAGVKSSLVCAVSVLPGDLVLSKPKLKVKPLALYDPKSKKRKRCR